MQERRIAKELQLEGDEGLQSAHLELQESSGRVDSKWQLREESVSEDWQPVEYTRPSRAEPNWILPSLVGLVLVVVAGYMVYIGLNRISSINLPLIAPVEPTSDASSDTVAEQPGPVVAAVEQEATNTPEPSEEPTETAEPTEAPTLEPTAVLVEQQIAIITNQFGVNARLAPSTNADVLRILEEGESVVVLDEQEATDIEGNWLQVRTSEDAVVWISSQFVEISTQLVPEEPSTAASELPTLGISVTISSPAGLNARAEPDSASEIVELLPDNSTYPALRRSSDGQWIEVQLEDGSTAWIFLQLVIANQDLAELPTLRDEVAAVDEPSIDESGTPTDTTELDASLTVTDTLEGAEPLGDVALASEITGTEVLTETTGDALADVDAVVEVSGNESAGDQEGQATVDTGETISITSQFGVNARSTTSTDAQVIVVLQAGSEIPLRGRNADDSWLQVILEDGTLAWVFAQAVETSANIEDLPVFEPPAVDAPAETLSETGETSEEPAADLPDAEPADSGDASATEQATPSEGTARVTAILGAKVRPAPTTEESEIETVPFDTEFSVLGRSEDGEWLQVQLENGDAAWILVSKVAFDGTVADLPVAE